MFLIDGPSCVKNHNGEKKELSYAKDRRNNYGENDKSSRKNIPLRKSKVNRSYRRKINVILSETNISNREQIEHIENDAKSVRRQSWRKCADEPLGTFVKRKLERRESHAGNGKAARKQATEFLKTLKIETQQEDDGRWIAQAIDMTGVMVYGKTEQDAIEECRSLVGFVFLESLGAVEILKSSEYAISIISK